MRRAFGIGLLGAALCAGMLAGPARAAAAEDKQAPKGPKAYAVVVGIGDYADKAIQPRAKAVADAQGLYDLLVSKGHLGIEPGNVKLLLGGAEDAKRHSEPATRENILKAARWVAGQAGKDDLVVIAFFGQGAALGDRADRIAYLSSDSDVKDLAKTAVAAASLGEELDKLKSHRVVSLVDVYFKGYTPAGGGTPPDPNFTSMFKEFLGHEEGEEGTPAPGRVLYLASSGRNTWPDTDKHGGFAQVVLDGLGGKADKEGYEPDGVITVDELSEYLDKTLAEVRRKLPQAEKDRPRQIALFGEDAHFVIGKNPAVAAEAAARLEKFAQLAGKDSKITPEIAREGTTYLSRMPKLEAQRSLRKEYQALADGKVDVEGFLKKRQAVLDGMKLRRAVALEFAEKVLEATRMIGRDYVKEINQGEMIAWAITGLFKRLNEKVPEDITKRLAEPKKLKEKELLAILADARQHLGQREDLDKHKDIDTALQRMLNHLDPYTTFYDPESLEREKSQIQGRFIGVGIQIRKDPNTDQLQVITPIMGGPAYKAGIQAGDLVTQIIREVDNMGKPLPAPEVTQTKGLDISEAVKKILGQPKTKVKLVVQRPGEDKPREFELVRNLIQVETVLGYKRRPDASWDFVVDGASKIGYVRLTQFTRNSYPDMVKAVANLKKEGVKGFVLDLRFNPGGLLDSARDISDLFIDDGVIVSIRPRQGQEFVMSGRKENSNTDFPMVCLVNGGSASGSEIVSAALQDHHRALILGERSYGKGSVQNVVDFEKEGGEVKSQIKLTTASFWRPSGKNLNKSSTGGKDTDEWGVRPDREIKLSRAERDELFEHQRNQEIIQPKEKSPGAKEAKEYKDRQLEAALDYLREQIKVAGKVAPRKAG